MSGRSIKIRLIRPTTPLDGARCLHRGDGIIEARILPHDDSARPLGGFFKTPERLADALACMNGKLSNASVYVTLNPVKRSLLARAKNRFVRATSGGQAKDGDILKRAWFAIDVDPVRPKNLPASDDELRAAIAKRDAIVRWLQTRGWPACVKNTSGNGAHALFPVDLPNTKEIATTFKRALKALDAQFSDARVKVDTSVSNASRIWRLYGTVNRKGTASKQRPHRRAVIEVLPKLYANVSREQLDALAGLVAKPVGMPGRAPTLLDAFKRKGMYIRDLGDGRHAVRCPWADEHTTDSTDTETVLFDPSAGNGGRGGFKCQHDHCGDRGIADVLGVMPIRIAELRCLKDIKPERVEFFWFPYIPTGKLTLSEGDPGIGKSWLSLQLASAASHGRGLPGMLRRDPANVLLLTAEDGLGDTIRPRLDAMGADLQRVFSLDGPIVFDDPGLKELDETIGRTGAALVVVDPLVAYLGAGVDLHRANETRAVMARLAAIAAKHDCAIVLIRHLTKSGKDKSIYRGLGSIDLTAACRSVLLVGRDPDDPHRAALVHIKSNLAKTGASQGFTVENGRFEWTGPSALTASDLLAPEASGSSGALEEAKAFLQSKVSKAAVEAAQVKKEAMEAGISAKTLRRAKELLGVRSKPERDDKGKALRWKWWLPKRRGDARATGQLGDGKPRKTQ